MLLLFYYPYKQSIYTIEKNMTEIKLIAEIGWNHMGFLKLAEKMIKAAKNSGADYAKFQTWRVKNLKLA
tara:strand:- start:58 stop:264 length:207 start_codon:yes stop_codon:yes gene_type:complete